MSAIAIGYVRVSSEQQAGEKQTSLQDQRTAILSLAERLGVTVTAWFEDAGYSGATVAKRPALCELIAHCARCPQKAATPGLVLVLNDSRFGRFDDPDEAAHLRFRLKGHGWIVRFAEADEIADPSLRHIMRAVGGAQASEYRRNLRANSTRGRIGTTRQGYWASREPFGYRRAVVYPPAQARVLDKHVPKARGEKIKLVPGPAEEVALVRTIFERYVLQGHSMRAICRWLNTVPLARDGRRPWAVSTLRGLLENRAYLGAIAARRRTAARMEHGDFGRGIPEYVIEHTHEPLITPDLFARAQELLQQIPARGHVHDYRVRGLVHCADCGEPFVGGGLGGDARGGAKARVRFYIDRGAREGQCPPPATSVSAHLLEAAIIEHAAAHIEAQLHPEVIERAITQRAEAVAAPNKQKDLTKRRAEALRRRERLMVAVEAGDLTMDEVRERLATIREELAQMERESAAVEAEGTVRTTIDRLCGTAKDFRTIAGHATGPELRTLLHPWIERMTFDRRTRALTMTMRTLLAVLLPPLLRAGNGRKQTRGTVTTTVVVSPASAVTWAARRHA